MTIRKLGATLAFTLAIAACAVAPLPSVTETATAQPTRAPKAAISPTPPHPPDVQFDASRLPSLQAAELPACAQPGDLEVGDLSLAFVSDWDADGEVYAVRADGSGLAQVTDNTTKEALPRWSPDGQQLAYLDDLFQRSRLVISDADGSNASVVAPDLVATWEVVWSPTGRQVVFRSGPFQGGDLFALDVQTSEAVNLTRGAAPAHGRPSFSPEGDRIVFAAEMPDSAGPPHYRLFTVRADGTGLTELSFPSGDVDYWPKWHPSRDEILFQGLVPGQGVGLHVATLDGSVAKLKAKPRYLVSYPSWSPDGSMFAYVALDLQNEVEFHVATESEDVDRIVLDSEIAGDEYWGINRYFWAPDSRHVAFFGSGGAYRSNAIYVMDICGGQPQLVVEEVDPDSEVSWRPLPGR